MTPQALQSYRKTCGLISGQQQDGRLRLERAAISEDPFDERCVCRVEMESLLKSGERLIPILTLAPARVVELDHLIPGNAKLIHAGLILSPPFEDSF
jgi:hypothetical protein